MKNNEVEEIYRKTMSGFKKRFSKLPEKKLVPILQMLEKAVRASLESHYAKQM